ncbi:MAG TPA: type II toxin-antitoxin system VapC family toxin [Thermoplasmata archaeon]|nr:type II toxin-antitoxin system VapC family toxin [Thermoplasmata archaeon]
MRCLETTFVIDLLRGDAVAAELARTWHEAGEDLAVAAPTIAEVLTGAYYRGGEALKAALSLLAQLEVLEIDRAVASEAGRIGAGLMRQGSAASRTDLLIAAAAMANHRILVTRDERYSQVPGLLVESY